MERIGASLAEISHSQTSLASRRVRRLSGGGGGRRQRDLASVSAAAASISIKNSVSPGFDVSLPPDVDATPKESAEHMQELQRLREENHQLMQRVVQLSTSLRCEKCRRRWH